MPRGRNHFTLRHRPGSANSAAVSATPARALRRRHTGRCPSCDYRIDLGFLQIMLYDVNPALGADQQSPNKHPENGTKWHFFRMD
jgi:hypothetical protein